MKIQTQKDVAKIFTPERVEMMKAKIGPEGTVTGCCEWTGAVEREGYPIMYVRHDGKQTYFRVHRALWIHNNRRDIPAGLEIHHGCHNRCCLNPKHLELSTRPPQVANTYRMRKPNGKRGRIKYRPEYWDYKTPHRQEMIRLVDKFVEEERRKYLLGRGKDAPSNPKEFREWIKKIVAQVEDEIEERTGF